MAEFTEVPLEIIHEILSHVPAKYLLRLRCVCKAWKDMIDDQSFFAKSHIKKQQFSSSTILTRNKEEDGELVCLSLDSLSDGEELDIISLDEIILPGVPRLISHLPTLSCNGLILIIPHDSMPESWAIWNPLLQHYHLLPPPPPPEATGLKESDKYQTLLAIFGFGYDEGSDDYKVVRVHHFYHREFKDYYYRTTVYSLKSGSWRSIDDFPGGDCLGDHAAFLDGTLYWRSHDGVVALDLGTEAYRLVAAPPPYISNKKKYSERLDAFDGWLIWSWVHVHGHDMEAEAWVMMEDYSWTKLYSVVTPDMGRLRIVGYLKSKGKVVFSFSNWPEDGDGDGDGDRLRWLDLENTTWRDITFSRLFCSSLSSSAIYIPILSLSFTQISPLSLVRLDNHYKNKNKNKNTSTGVKRKRQPKPYQRKLCGEGLWRKYIVDL